MKKIKIDCQVYFDNSCKQEDLWGHYETAKGDLYVVMDGVSNHDGTRTGRDVVQHVHQRLTGECSNIKHRKDLIELLHAINTETTQVNAGAYAAVAGTYIRGNKIYVFSAGDVSILAKKMNGKLIQVLPLDLRMPRAEAERLARAEIGATVNNILVTDENLEQRVQQYMQHGLCNALGMGDVFTLHDLNFSARDGTALLLATDGITDPFMASMIDAGGIKLADAPKLYQVFDEGETAEAAVKSLEEIIWNTQVVEKKRLKQDDRTAMFIFMTHIQQAKDHKKAALLE
ncbi:MAG TPA: PP2C family serine/threonine-protein phosphatase [Gammaproteobacteria bacterium]|nr:PP2C family serine/threonine-protein phosphatase [Gammaproteobacteria bacterium]